MIPVLIPFRPDHDRRDRLFAHLRDWYWEPLSFPIVTGESPDGPFNRSAAINDAATKAGDWDIAIIADNDTWVPVDQLISAIGKTNSTRRLTAAFTSVVELSQECTDALLEPPMTVQDFGIDQIRTDPLCVQSSMLVVHRELWDQVGGFDEQFTGWGAEDNAFFLACTLAAGEPHRIPGHAFHLWHQPAQRDMRDIHYRANQKRWRRYQQANTLADIRRIRG